MIALPPVVRETDDGPVVEDQEGYRLVLRTDSGKSGNRTYHDPDPEAAREGEKAIYCKYGATVMSGRPSDLKWRRETAIDGVWTACGHCRGDAPDEIGDGGGTHGTSLATQLRRNDDGVCDEIDAALTEGVE